MAANNGNQPPGQQPELNPEQELFMAQMKAMFTDIARAEQAAFGAKVSTELQQHINALTSRMARLETSTATTPQATVATTAPEAPQSAGEKAAGMMSMIDAALSLLIEKGLPLFMELQKSKQMTGLNSFLSSPQLLAQFKQERPMEAQMVAMQLGQVPMAQLDTQQQFQTLLTGLRMKQALVGGAEQWPQTPTNSLQPSSSQPGVLTPRLADVLPASAPANAGASMTQRPGRAFKMSKRSPEPR